MEQKQTQDYVKKNPDTPIMILLEHTNRHPDLAWRIIWGTSVSTSNFSVYVDASTGCADIIGPWGGRSPFSISLPTLESLSVWLFQDRNAAAFPI